MSSPDSTDTKVDLVGTVELLYRYLTESLCREVFRAVRIGERERKWTFHALAQFWTEVILRAPEALTHALQDCAEGVAPWPRVCASEEAFFQKSAALRPRFFQALFERFLGSILPEAQPVFGKDLGSLYDRFPEVWVMDGSRLSAVWHRLKALWKVRNVILPGALLVLYDLRRGIPRYVQYTVDAARAETHRGLEAVARLARGVLVLADRLYAVPKVFAAVTARGAWIVARRNRTVKLRPIRVLSVSEHEGGQLTDTLVEVGGTGGVPRQTWRHIAWRVGNTVYEVVTNVLDPAMLSAAEAIRLYPKRWTIERMFYDLKEVLNLNRIYASHPHTVAQQVYASALVYTALRVGQGHVALRHAIEPEAISVPKFFPRLSAAAANYTAVKITLETVVELNPHQTLVLPDLRQMKFASAPLRAILVEKRNPKRRTKRFCKARRQWKSFAHIRGTKHLVKN